MLGNKEMSPKFYKQVLYLVCCVKKQYEATVEKLPTDPVVDKNKIKEHMIFSEQIWFTERLQKAKQHIGVQYLPLCPVNPNKILHGIQKRENTLRAATDNRESISKNFP